MPVITSNGTGGGDWNVWTVSGTPTRTTQAFLTISCIGTAGHIVVADMIVLGPNVNTGDCNNWAHGRSAVDLFAVQVSAPDIATAVWEKVITDISSAGSAAKQVNAIKTEADKIQGIDNNVDTVVTLLTVTLPLVISSIDGKIDIIDSNIDTVKIDTGTTIPGTLTTISDKIDIIDGVVDALPSASVIADAVLDETTGTHTGIIAVNLDAKVSDKLSTSSYIAPDNTSIGNIKEVTEKLDMTLEADGLVYKFTENALEEATGGEGNNQDILDAIDGVSDKIDSLQINVDFIRDIEEGDWKVKDGQMIFYKSDHVTVIKTFDLYDNLDDKATDATVNIFKRVGV